MPETWAKIEKGQRSKIFSIFSGQRLKKWAKVEFCGKELIWKCKEKLIMGRNASERVIYLSKAIDFDCSEARH